MARIDDYVAWLSAHGGDRSGLRFAVDCSDGAAGILAKKLFPDAVVVNDVPDGNFPHHSPNPLKAEAREQIAALVRELGRADCRPCAGTRLGLRRDIRWRRRSGDVC